MKILFSPSEAKASIKEGDRGECVLSKEIASLHQKYLDFVINADLNELQKCWGLKRMEDVMQTKMLSLDFSILPAILCYRGVGYEALDFDSLRDVQKEFILDSVLIFSNLFGAICARENLPFYKLKQGEGFGDFKSKDLYAIQEESLDRLLDQECVVDLRAGFYQSIYKVKTHHFAFDFLKNNKRLSHYAKYYRGIVLREIAQEGGMETLFDRLELSGLKHLATEENKNQTKFIFAVK